MAYLYIMPRADRKSVQGSVSAVRHYFSYLIRAYSILFLSSSPLFALKYAGAMSKTVLHPETPS